jgi:hypothetical protein
MGPNQQSSLHRLKNSTTNTLLNALMLQCTLPESANVWRPPAATAAIFTPVLNVTIQGGAERFSSLDVELSCPCFAEDNRRLFVLSSVPLLSEGPDAAPLLVLDACDLELTAMELPLLYDIPLSSYMLFIMQN